MKYYLAPLNGKEIHKMLLIHTEKYRMQKKKAKKIVQLSSFQEKTFEK